MTILDAIYPPHCAICDKVISPSGSHICDSCRRRLPYVGEPRCLRCGKEIENEEEEYCRDCSSKRRTFIKGFPLFKYVPPVSDSVMEMKYSGRQEHAVFYGEEMAAVFGERYLSLGIQALIPVPLHKKKLIIRGYNQAELIARVIGKKLDIPVVTDLIIRNENTRPQNELDNIERENNIKSAFTGNEKNYLKKHGKLPEIVMLIDDIYTTGATIEACTEICYNLGIREVYYTSACIGAAK